MKPEEFERTDGPILSDEGFVYEAWEAARGALCPSAAPDLASSKPITRPS